MLSAAQVMKIALQQTGLNMLLSGEVMSVNLH